MSLWGASQWLNFLILMWRRQHLLGVKNAQMTSCPSKISWRTCCEYTQVHWSNIEDRSKETLPLLNALGVFNPLLIPDDPTELSRHGAKEINIIADHFATGIERFTSEESRQKKRENSGRMAETEIWPQVLEGHNSRWSEVWKKESEWDGRWQTST